MRFQRRLVFMFVLSCTFICLYVLYMNITSQDSKVKVSKQQSPRPVPVRESSSFTQSSTLQHSYKALETDFGSELDKKLSCRQNTGTPRFIEVEKGTLLYSAWFDDRQDQNYIQVLLLTSRRKNPPPLSCRFQSGSSPDALIASVASSYYEINKRRKKRYGLFVASCALPKEVDTTQNVPCHVDISIKLTSEQPNSSVVLPVGNTKASHSATDSKRIKYGICVPPLHGHTLVGAVIEFLELSQLLGVSYFTFYDFEISENVRKVLNYYEGKGLVQVFPWNLPPYIRDSDVHNYGQLLAIVDCLFRSMNHLDFVALNDLDEYIVPLQYGDLSSMLRSIHKENHCGHCFQGAKFVVSGDKGQISWPVTQNFFNRSQKADRTHSKCVVDPRRVFEHSVHLIMRPLEGKCLTNKVDWNAARVFHYRECPPHCDKNLKEDKAMKKYSEQLRERIRIVIPDIGDFNK